MDALRRSHAAYIRQVPERLLKPVKVYTANSTWFNSHCRQSLKGLPRYISEKFEYRSAAISHVIAASPALPAMTVFRGFCPFDGFAKYKAGDVVPQKAPVSTTYDRKLAVSFMQQQLCCLLVIRVPAGTHGLLVESISRYPDESEVLLPSGGSFRIDAVDSEKFTNGSVRTVFSATWVPPPLLAAQKPPQKLPKTNRAKLKQNFVSLQRQSGAFQEEVADLMELGMNRKEAEEEALQAIMQSYKSKLNPSTKKATW